MLCIGLFRTVCRVKIDSLFGAMLLRLVSLTNGGDSKRERGEGIASPKTCGGQHYAGLATDDCIRQECCILHIFACHLDPKENLQKYT